MAYHIEICVLLVHLYRSLCENFEGHASWEDIRSCVDIHRPLIDVTKMFDVVFSRSLFGLVDIGCYVIIASATVILFSVYPEPFCFSSSFLLSSQCIWHRTTSGT